MVKFPYTTGLLLIILMTGAAAASVDSAPAPALLEMMGAIDDIEELGVDIETMIKRQLDIEHGNEKQEQKR